MATALRLLGRREAAGWGTRSRRCSRPSSSRLRCRPRADRPGARVRAVGLGRSRSEHRVPGDVGRRQGLGRPGGRARRRSGGREMSATPTLSLSTRLSVIVTRSASIVSRPVPVGRRERRFVGVGRGVGPVVAREPVAVDGDVARVRDRESGCALDDQADCVAGGCLSFPRVKPRPALERRDDVPSRENVAKPARRSIVR